MATTGLASFDTTVTKTNRVLLREIEERYGWSKEQRARSYAALRSVLHALRDRLNVEECADFFGRLPMLIRGGRVPLKLRREEEFLERVTGELSYDEVEDGGEGLTRGRCRRSNGTSPRTNGPT